MLQGILLILENVPDDAESIKFFQMLEASELTLVRLPQALLFASELPTTMLSQAFESHKLCPTDCLLITDLKTILPAAKAVGCPCIGYLGAAGNYDDFSGAYALLESFEGTDISYLFRTHAHALSYPAEITSTDRLIIREFSASDFAALYPLCTAPETAPFMEETLSGYHTEYEKHLAYLSNIYPVFDLALWGVFEKESGVLIGRAGFSLPDTEDDCFSLGYLIAPPYRRQGYASECVSAVLSYAKELGYSEISVRIKRNNIASGKVLEHCTFPYKCLSAPDARILTYRIFLTPI